MATPPWNSRRSGVIGDAAAMANANDVNQFLGTHAQQLFYAAVGILLPGGTGGVGTGLGQINLLNLDIDQPFVLANPATSVGRVLVPLLAVGNGADLLLSVCQDNAGVPGTLINQTRVPAAFTTTLGAPEGLDNAGPLATAQGNTLLFKGWQTIPWSPPATSPTGGLNTAQMVQSGGYFIFAGGINAANANSSSLVTVIPWTGGTTIGASAPGPNLPQTVQAGGLAVTSDSLCYIGGVNVTGASTVVQSTVYLASWNSGTGTIGSWSVQTALPHGLVFPGVAAYDATDTVYVVGGSTNYAGATAAQNTVYYSTIANSQISAWNVGTPLPASVIDPTVAVIDNWLIVAGGFFGSGNGNIQVYYAPINPTTGAPGNWLLGPAIPNSVYVEGQTCTTNNAIVWPQTLGVATSIVAQDTLILTWDSTGPGTWTHQVGPLPALNADQVTGIVETDNGVYQMFNFQTSAYLTATVLSMPMISVPVPTSGMTIGNTYHILMQQLGGDINNYLTTVTDASVFTGSPTALTSPRRGYSWTAAGPTGTAVPLYVADAAVLPLSSGNTGFARHLWDDNGLRWTTFVRNSSPDYSLIGICEATTMTTAANANTGFETTLTPWTVTGGTAVRSSTQAFEGQWSAQVTPSGAATIVFLQSELLPCMPGQSVTIDGWVWCTNSVTTNFSMSINWFTVGSVFINTSSNNISIPAATWTHVTNTFTATTAGGGAYQYTLNPALSGTPAAGQIFYVDTTIGYPTFIGQQLVSATQISYVNATYPNINSMKPTGLISLA